jgi:hypothetical protein
MTLLCTVTCPVCIQGQQADASGQGVGSAAPGVPQQAVQQLPQHGMYSAPGMSPQLSQYAAYGMAGAYSQYNPGNPASMYGMYGAYGYPGFPQVRL